jgi:hypothetical protein
LSLASALNILHPTLPYYIALAKYDLLHLLADSFEFRPHRKAPPPAIEMACTVFALIDIGSISGHCWFERS